MRFIALPPVSSYRGSVAADTSEDRQSLHRRRRLGTARWDGARVVLIRAAELAQRRE
jgi:hypothetical protein